jgi:hypothetical protein
MPCSKRPRPSIAQRAVAHYKPVSHNLPSDVCNLVSFTFLALMTVEGQGYLQQNFGMRCARSNCTDQPTITKAVLGARKLAEDLIRSNGTVSTYLAYVTPYSGCRMLINAYTLYRGTLYTPQLALDVGRGKAVKDAIMTSAKFARPKDSTDEQWIVSILQKSKYSLDYLRLIMAQKTRGGNL